MIPAPLPAEVLAAGWPLAAALAAALASARVREGRRRGRAGAALHELRRPLQAIALAPAPGPGGAEQAELALAALEDVECAVSGRPRELCLRPQAMRPLVERAVERWRPVAGHRNGSGPGIELRWEAGRALALVDPRRIEQALDNLIANAVEHGRTPVTIVALAGDGSLRLTVRNPIAEGAAGPAGGARPARRGWGLSIVAAIAAVHGGRFLFDRSGGFATGTLELPLAGAGAARAAPVPRPGPVALAARGRPLDGRLA